MALDVGGTTPWSGATLDGAVRRRVVAGSALVAVVVLAAAMLWRAPDGAGENLQPRVDALEYAVVAVRLADGHSPTIPIGSSTYPSRFPIGFPLLLVPGVWAGLPPERLHLVVQALATIGVGLTYLTTRRMAGVAIATWAAAMLALSSSYVRLGSLVMSDVPSAVATVMWGGLLLRDGAGFALGVVAGLGCSLRLVNIPLVVGGAVACIPAGSRRGRYAAGVATGLLPLVVSSFAASGGVGGYAFWMPEVYASPLHAFGLGVLRTNLASYGPQLLGVARLPELYSLPVVLLAGVAMRQASRAMTILGGTAIAYVVIALPYFFMSSRLLLPALPLVLLAAASGLATVSRRRGDLAAALALVTLTLQAVAGLRATRTGDANLERDYMVLAAVRAHLPRDVVVVSDVPGAMAWLYCTAPASTRTRPSGLRLQLA